MSSGRRKREPFLDSMSITYPQLFWAEREISPAKLEDQSGEIPPNLFTLGWLSVITEVCGDLFWWMPQSSVRISSGLKNSNETHTNQPSKQIHPSRSETVRSLDKMTTSVWFMNKLQTVPEEDEWLYHKL